MNKSLFFCLILITGLSCNNKFPLPLEEGMTDSKDIPHDTISIEDIKLNELNIRTDLALLIDKFGEPDSIWEYGGAFTPNKFLSDTSIRKARPDDRIKYKTYFYKGFEFAVWGNNAILTEIDFTKSDYNLNYKGIKFSKMTTLKDLKRIFPNSYKWQRQGLSIFMTTSYDTFEHIDKESITWMHFSSFKYSKYFRIEMTFINNRLTNIYFPRYE